MIVYSESKANFCEDVLLDRVADRIKSAFLGTFGHGVSDSEFRSWKNSMEFMYKVINDDAIPADSGIAIEFQIPQSGKRVDFIITGLGDDGGKVAILVELKQWGHAEVTDSDGVVITLVGGGNRAVAHPSYQAWSYASLLENFNSSIAQEDISLKPCAYLHNYPSDGAAILDSRYAAHVQRAPVFMKGDALRLREFIKNYVRRGDAGKIIFTIENGEIRPSKALADSLVGMMRGNQEFVMIDEQKVAYEKALSLATATSPEDKVVLIVKGGPGTGKSVVAINLLVELTKRGFSAQYVSKNSAPRAVYQSKLTGTMRKTEISNLFHGSGSFWSSRKNEFHTLIVDEAHRLNAKSGLYGDKGENQVKEIISASRCSVFFLDEDQKVTFGDIGTQDEIEKWAKDAGASLHYEELSSQFRCAGSDGYLAWIDDVLGIRQTANKRLGAEYKFKVYETPSALREAISFMNEENNKARMVAGYCWEWKSKKTPSAYDIEFPEDGFQMRWNLTEDGMLWILNPKSVNEVGCIHTCQGLEVDHIGVIVGPDLVYRDGMVMVDPSKRAKSDKSLRGFKKWILSEPDEAMSAARAVIKNTYRTLMTRGMKGCHVYCADAALADYLRSRI